MSSSRGEIIQKYLNQVEASRIKETYKPDESEPERNGSAARAVRDTQSALDSAYHKFIHALNAASITMFVVLTIILLILMAVYWPRKSHVSDFMFECGCDR